MATGIGLALCVCAISAVAQTDESASAEVAPSAAEVEPKLVVTGRALLDAFAALADEIGDLERDFEARVGEEQLLLGRSVERKKVEILRLIRPILDNKTRHRRGDRRFAARRLRDTLSTSRTGNE